MSNRESDVHIFKATEPRSNNYCFCILQFNDISAVCFSKMLLNGEITSTQVLSDCSHSFAMAKIVNTRLLLKSVGSITTTSFKEPVPSQLSDLLFLYSKIVFTL